MTNKPKDKLHDELVFAIMQSGTCDDEEQARIGANACMVFVKEHYAKMIEEVKQDNIKQAINQSTTKGIGYDH